MNTRRRAGAPRLPYGRQQGFSMVEMLMAAFIMAIGILGLTMLQTMSLRTNAGSRSVTSAILVADRILDQAEALGRNSLLWARDGNGNSPPILNPNYFGTADITQYFNFDGTYNAAAAYYTVTVHPTVASPPYPGIGGLQLITVTVAWSDSVDATHALIPRTVVISRRVSYATS